MAACFSCFRPENEEPVEEGRRAPTVPRQASARKSLPEHELLVASTPPTIGTPAHPAAGLGRLSLREAEEQFASHPEKSPALVFTFRELQIATQRFRPENLLGEGGFGRVYKGRLERTGQIVAVKQLDRTGLQGNAEFRVEVSMLSLLHHENLVNLIGYCADGDQRLLVYEFMPLGCLEDHLHDIPPDREPLDWFTRMKVAYGAAKGLEYLHDKADPPVIYRDFKSSNILLDVGFHPKLSDFGLAKLGPTGDKTHVSTRVMGTYGYCAPEYAMTGQLTTKSDVYSFGVVLLELITGRRAIDNSRQRQSNLVAWARPLFKDRRTFPSMADPLLQGRYPMRALYQAMAVAAMCLQETAVLRPQIGDVVMALNHLANQRQEPGDSHARRPSRDMQRPAARGGPQTPERRMQGGVNTPERRMQGGVNTPERRMQHTPERRGGGEDRWGHGRGGYENVRQAGSARRREEESNERERALYGRGAYRRDDEFANGGGRMDSDSSHHSRKPSSDSFRLEPRDSDPEPVKRVMLEEAGTSYGDESAPQSPQVDTFTPPPLRQEYAYPPSTREHPAFAGTAKSAILEKMPSWESKRKNGGASVRHRVLERVPQERGQQQIAETPDQVSPPLWDQQKDPPPVENARSVFDAEVPEMPVQRDSLELRNIVRGQNPATAPPRVSGAFGSVVYPAAQANEEEAARDVEQSGELSIDNERSSPEPLENESAISPKVASPEIQKTTWAAAPAPSFTQSLPDDSSDKPVRFLASSSFKAQQERGLDSTGRVAFLWEQQPPSVASPFEAPQISPRTKSPLSRVRQQQTIAATPSQVIPRSRSPLVSFPSIEQPTASPFNPPETDSRSKSPIVSVPLKDWQQNPANPLNSSQANPRSKSPMVSIPSREQPSAPNPFNPAQTNPRSKSPIVSVRSRARTPERLVSFDSPRESWDRSASLRGGNGSSKERVGSEGYAWAQLTSPSSGRGVQPNFRQDSLEPRQIADSVPASEVREPSLASVGSWKDRPRLSPRARSPRDGFRGAWQDAPNRLPEPNGSGNFRA